MSLPQVERVVKTIENLCKRHKGEIYSLVLDWEIKEVSNPRYEGKLQHLVPVLVIDFK